MPAQCPHLVRARESASLGRLGAGLSDLGAMNSVRSHDAAGVALQAAVSAPIRRKPRRPSSRQDTSHTQRMATSSGPVERSRYRAAKHWDRHKSGREITPTGRRGVTAQRGVSKQGHRRRHTPRRPPRRISSIYSARCSIDRSLPFRRRALHRVSRPVARRRNPVCSVPASLSSIVGR
jgi:hypothetical protein